MATLVLRNKIWHVVFRQDRKQIWRSTGTGNRAEAEAALAEVTELRAGRRREDLMRNLLTVAGTVTVPAGRAPLDGIWELYEKQSTRERAANTWRAKKFKVQMFTRWITKRHPECLSAADITPRLAAEFIQHLAKDGKAGQTLNNTLSALRTVWDALRIPFSLRDNPWKVVPRREAKHDRREALTLTQVAEQ